MAHATPRKTRVSHGVQKKKAGRRRVARMISQNRELRCGVDVGGNNLRNPFLFLTSRRPTSRRLCPRPASRGAAAMATNLSRVHVKWLLSLSLSSHVKNPKRCARPPALHFSFLSFAHKSSSPAVDLVGGGQRGCPSQPRNQGEGSSVLNPSASPSINPFANYPATTLAVRHVA